MSVNRISNVTDNFMNNPVTTKTSIESANNKEQEPAAVYETSGPLTKDSSKKIYTRDTATIEHLKAESDKRAQQLIDLVRKSLNQQGITFGNATEMYQLLRDGEVKVDAETATQAQKDIAEDGYWGVEQTSERLFSFATALSGGDPEKADKMIAAVKKGFEEATKTWGGKLPDISQRTLDATLLKLSNWKNSINTEKEKETTSVTTVVYTNQI